MINTTLFSQQPVTPNQVEMLILPPTGSDDSPPLASLISWIQPDAPCNRVPSGQDPALGQVNPLNAEVSDPFFEHTGKICLVPLPKVAPGSYRAAAVFIAPECLDSAGIKVSPCRSGRTISPTVFSVTNDTSCNPNPVSLAVGEWTRQVPAKGYGRVSYSLLSSKTPIVTLIVRFNGIEQDVLRGSDLRHVAASYFAVGTEPGSYQFSITVSDDAGCTDGGNRPMTIVVN